MAFRSNFRLLHGHIRPRSICILMPCNAYPGSANVSFYFVYFVYAKWLFNKSCPWKISLRRRGPCADIDRSMSAQRPWLLWQHMRFGNRRLPWRIRTQKRGWNNTHRKFITWYPVHAYVDRFNSAQLFFKLEIWFTHVGFSLPSECAHQGMQGRTCAGLKNNSTRTDNPVPATTSTAHVMVRRGQKWLLDFLSVEMLVDMYMTPGFCTWVVYRLAEAWAMAFFCNTWLFFSLQLWILVADRMDYHLL